MFDEAGRLTPEGEEALVVQWVRYFNGDPLYAKQIKNVKTGKMVSTERYAVVEPYLVRGDGKTQSVMLPRHQIDSSLFDHPTGQRVLLSVLRKMQGEWGVATHGGERNELVHILTEDGQVVSLSKGALRRQAAPGTLLHALGMSTGTGEVYRAKDLDSEALNAMLIGMSVEARAHPDDLVALRMYQEIQKGLRGNPTESGIPDRVGEAHLKNAYDKDFC